jgi:hypothetical protein
MNLTLGINEKVYIVKISYQIRGGMLGFSETLLKGV